MNKNEPLTLLQEKLILEDCLKIAALAGKKLLKYQKRIASLKITYKEAQGVASSADVETEKLILNFLKNRYKEHAFLAEETFHASKRAGEKAMEVYKKMPWCWAIDPLDGTHNYLNGHHYYSISMALLHYGDPVVGVVYRPATGECFFATNSTPAYKINLSTQSNGKLKSIKKKKKLLRPTNPKKLKDALLLTGFATEKGELFDQEFELFKKMMGSCRGIRRFGSAALDLCYVAEGAWDGFWERGLAPWDTAAASLISKKAGVLVRNYQNKNQCPFDATIVSAREPLFNELIKAI